MARDPAFLYYDGDASKDMAHMNRLERGAYIDLVHAQKKFGRLSIDIIKKVLGKDFETCWVSIELVLSLADGKYFIEWLENSIAKRESFSESRRRNRQKKDKKETYEEDMLNTSEDMKKICETYEQHMEIEIENEIEEVNEEQGDGVEEGHNPYLIPAMLVTWKKNIPTYPEDHGKDYPALLALSEFICKQAKAPYNPRDGGCMSLILTQWEKWAVFVSKHDFFKRYSLAQVNTHSQNILQSIEDGKHNGRQSNQNGQNQQPRGTVISDEKEFGKL